MLRTLKKSLSGRPTSVGKTDQQPLFCDKRPQHSSLCGRCDRWCALFAGALTSKRPLLSHALAVRRRGPCAHRPSAIGRCQDNSPPHCCLRGIKSGCSGHGFFVPPTYPVGPRPRADFFCYIASARLLHAIRARHVSQSGYRPSHSVWEYPQRWTPAPVRRSFFPAPSHTLIFSQPRTGV